MRGEGVFADSIRALFKTACRQAGLEARKFKFSTDHFRVPGPQSSLLSESDARGFRVTLGRGADRDFGKISICGCFVSITGDSGGSDQISHGSSATVSEHPLRNDVGS
jgi:hypothetical protein